MLESGGKMELPLIAYSMFDKLTFHKTGVNFADRYTNVSVFQVSGGRNSFAAFVYMCRLNLDLDGAPTSYGYDDPAKPRLKNGARGAALQQLDPLESWHKGWPGVWLEGMAKLSQWHP